MKVGELSQGNDLKKGERVLVYEFGKADKEGVRILAAW